MKKIIFILIAFLSLNGVVMAQHQWSVGPRLGIGFSNRAEGYDYCNHFVGGIFGEYRISNFATELDLLFTKQGMRYPESDTSQKDKCLSIPLKAKLYMPYVLRGLNIFVGPQLDIFPDRHSPYIPTSSFGTDSYRKVGISIVMGLGYRFDFGLDLTFNYNAGVTSNIDMENISDKNRVFQLTAGYDLCKLFKLCGKK